MQQFHDDLKKILADFEENNYSPGTSALDILFAYRLLLFRNPEARVPIELEARAQEFPATQDLTRGFMSSTEFRDNFFGKSQRPDGRIVIVRDGDLRIAVHLDDQAISGGIINGCYELETQWLVRALVKPGTTCIDLGANLGYFTALMASLTGDGGKVYAFEPFPTVFRMLSLTVEESGLSHRVSLRQKACSDRPSTARLCFVEESNNFGGSFLMGEGTSGGAGLSSVDVEVTSIDVDLAGALKIDFIKMDVEGNEVKALQGMKQRLLADRPLLVTEINPDGLATQQASPESVLQLLEEVEYRSFLVSPLFAGETVEAASGSSEAFPPGSFENIVCFPAESADQLLSELLSSGLNLAGTTAATAHCSEQPRPSTQVLSNS